MRARFAGLLGAAIIAASCGSPSATPSPTPTAAPSISPSPTVDPDASPSPGQTAAPTLSPEPAAEGRWETTGPMALARGLPRAVLLGDGTVIVVGNDDDVGYGCVRADSIQSETWDRASGTWSAGPSLNAPRADFAAAQVAGGGVLVTGGVTAGVTSQWGDQNKHQSYSSTYVLDPRTEPAGLSRVGLLDRARTLPSSAMLLDGRVLVAGGYYLDGIESGAAPASGIRLASYRGSAGGSMPGARTFGDVAPPHIAPTWATAELYDPATGSWSGTGPLRYARVGAPAVTLVDGRVLVVGSARVWLSWNYTQAIVDDRAYATAEIYDPRTGRFSLTGDLPPVDWSPLARWGPYPVSSEGVRSPGALVALADGGALLVGEVTEWWVPALGRSGTTVRTMRFDPGGAWTLVDERVQASNPDDPTAPIEVLVDGHARGDSRAVQLRDGRVLIAGGRVATGDEATPTSTADLYDPATNTWLELPPMPEPRAGGAAVLLDDGSVLVVGGDDGQPTCLQEQCDCGEGSTGTSSAVRFIPRP